MNIEPKQPPAPPWPNDGARWFEHVTDEQYKAAATATGRTGNLRLFHAASCPFKY